MNLFNLIENTTGGYDNLRALLQAVSTRSPAELNIGGDPITLDYMEANFLNGIYRAYLKAGRQEEFIQDLGDARRFDMHMKKLRDLIAKQKSFRGSVPGQRGVTGDVPAGVMEGRLNEFAPGGSEGNGPFEYGTAIIQIGEDFVDTYSDEGAGADAAAIIKVGRKFMSAGMKAGIRAFYAMDTQVRDHVAEELEDQGFNVRKDIYEPHDKSLPATTWTRPVTDADRDWYLLQDLIKEFSKARQGSVDPKTLEQLRQDFGWSLQMGFLELPKKSIRADFTDFAKSKGVDLTAMAKKYEVRRPAAEGRRR